MRMKLCYLTLDFAEGFTEDEYVQGGRGSSQKGMEIGQARTRNSAFKSCLFFNGRYNIKDFLDWIYLVEDFFDHMEIVEDKVQFSKYKLKKLLAYRERLQIGREAAGRIQ